MPTNFTGQTQWRETITGPANADEVTGPSVADMGVLLADRGQWQKQGTIGYYDERSISFNVSSTTDDTPIYTSQMTLTVDRSRVLVIQSLPLCTVVDGDVTVELLLYDASDVIVEATSMLALVADVTAPQLLLIGGFDAVPDGSYSFGIRVAAPGVSKFNMPTGNVRTVAMAYPLEGT